MEQQSLIYPFAEIVRVKAKKTVLVFGNPLVKKDSLALRILPRLRELMPSIEFVELDGTESEEIARYGPDVTVLDAAEGIEKPAIITDLGKFDLPRVVSMHDFDLAWNLRLLRKTGKLSSVKIIALPLGCSPTNAIAFVEKSLGKTGKAERNARARKGKLQANRIDNPDFAEKVKEK
jgi:Ni,Fe-hydrogenase maturation factor